MSRPGKLHERPHDVLDHQHPEPSACSRRMSAIAVSVSAGLRPAMNSSSSSSLGRRGQRPGQLQPLPVHERELGRRPLGPPLQPHEGEQPLGLGCRRRRRARGAAESRPTSTFSSAVSPANGRTSWNVRATPRSQTRCGAEPVMSMPRRRTARRRAQGPRDQVEERRLARSVRAHDPDHFAFRDREADFADRPDAAEPSRRARPRGGPRCRRPTAARQRLANGGAG